MEEIFDPSGTSQEPPVMIIFRFPNKLPNCLSSARQEMWSVVMCSIITNSLYLPSKLFITLCKQNCYTQQVSTHQLTSFFSIVCSYTDEVYRVPLPYNSKSGSDYINASFINVTHCILNCFLKAPHSYFAGEEVTAIVWHCHLYSSESVVMLGLGAEDVRVSETIHLDTHACIIL